MGFDVPKKISKKKTAELGKKAKARKKVKKKANRKIANRKIATSNGIKIVYGVEWIEVEFGQRSEGYALFLDKDECIRSTKRSSQRGPYPSGSPVRGGYYGPVRPLSYVEIPFDSLEPEDKKKLRKTGYAHTANRWSPKFKGTRNYIQ